MSTLSISSFAAPKESVCDAVKGGTPGLFGLCIAYVDATKSPLDLTTEESFANMTKQAKRLLARYNEKKQETDPEMPGITYYDEEACPAWTAEQLDSISLINIHPEGLLLSYDDGVLSYNGDHYQITDYVAGYSLEPDADGDHTIIVIGAQVDIDTASQVYTGSFGYLSSGGDETINTINLTYEEALACEQEILDHVVE